MSMNIDFSLLLNSLIDEQVDFVLIDGFAAVVLGVPYVTQDIDICYNPEKTNLMRLQRALAPLHPRLRVEGLTDEDAQALPFRLDERMLEQSPILTLRTDVAEIDMMIKVPGVGNYEQVKEASTRIEVLGPQLLVLDLPALIASKRAAGRPKDLLILPEIEATLRLREQENS
jgi:hypothetical protein